MPLLEQVQEGPKEPAERPIAVISIYRQGCGCPYT